MTADKIPELSPRSRDPLEKLIIRSDCQEIPLLLCYTKSLSPCLQEFGNGSYRKPDESNPQPPAILPEDPF
jgi:hypothetical protein